MAALKKLGGAYLIGVAVVVAGYFILNPWLGTVGWDVVAIWEVLDVFMALALLPALDYNFRRKRAADRRANGEGNTRRYIAANAAFYGTVAVAILFFHNWVSLLSGADLGLPWGDAPANHQAWVIWAIVDTLLPLVLGSTGVALWRDSAES